MLFTTHALTGAVIGKNFHNPWVIIILSVVLHFFMDTLRHGEYAEVQDSKTTFKKAAWKVSFDVFVSAAILVYFIRDFHLDKHTVYNIGLGVFFSVLPDLITALYWKFRWNVLAGYYSFHSGIHKYPRCSPERQWNLRNAANDIGISTLATVILFIK